MKKITLLLPILALIVYTGTSCNSPQANAAPQDNHLTEPSNGPIFKNVQADEFSSIITEGSVELIDVRTPGEYAQGHIEGASLHNYYDRNNFWNDVATWDKSKTYLLYCRSGSRSSSVMRKMKSMGFVSVYNLVGGIGSWARSGKPIVK